MHSCCLSGSINLISVMLKSFSILEHAQSVVDYNSLD